MNSGMVRESIAAVVMLATLGTTSAQEAAELAVTGPVLSNTGPDIADAGLHPDEARRQVGKSRLDLATRPPLP